MVNLANVTGMCKRGEVQEAYKVAQEDLQSQPSDIWNQRKMGWVLYYMLKDDVEKRMADDMHEHVRQLCALDALSPHDDAMLFDSCLWKLSAYVKSLAQGMEGEAATLFALLCGHHFLPSKAYSCFLHAHLHLTAWDGMVDFIEWWNLDSLLPEDYVPFALSDGKTVMSLAEHACIAYSKALLKMRDADRMRRFLPRLEKLSSEHPEMVYTGYFCGKLLISLHAGSEDVLHVLLPFVRKKKSEFWAWQLLAEVFPDSDEMRLACMLRAVHCRTRETFLGKVRQGLVSLYLARNDFGRARYQLERVVACYVQQKWRLTYELECWVHDEWCRRMPADESSPIDYVGLTDKLLAHDCDEHIAVVTYVDKKRNHAVLVYGNKKQADVRWSDLRVKPSAADLLRVFVSVLADGKLQVAYAETVGDEAIAGLDYVKRMPGVVFRPEGKPFAFVGRKMGCYVSPELVNRHELTGGERVTVLAVNAYNKKKDEWGWQCLTLLVDGVTT